MNKENINYWIIGAAATAIVYYLYSKSKGAAAPGSSTLPTMFGGAATDLNNLGTAISNAPTNIYNEMGLPPFDYSNFSGGAGGSW